MSESAGGGSSRYFKIGLFMLAGAALLVGGVIALGAGALFRRTIPAETLVYDSVDGLDVGSAVKYRGVPVGQVSGIVFASAKYGQTAATATPTTGPSAGRNVRGILIEMALTEQAFPGRSASQVAALAHQLIEQGLRTRVTPAGISGQSYVELDLLDPAQFPPPPIGFQPTVLYVPSAPSPLGQVFDAVARISAQLEQADLGRTVQHIDDLASRATATIDHVDQIVDANRDPLKRTLAQLPDTAAKLRATAARADQILNDPRVESALTGLDGTGPAAKAALADVRRLAREATALLDGESSDIRSTLADLRRLATDGAALTDDARQNPSRLLFGKPPPSDAPPAR